jgi:hypothetical protein
MLSSQKNAFLSTQPLSTPTNVRLRFFANQLILVTPKSKGCVSNELKPPERVQLAEG